MLRKEFAFLFYTLFFGIHLFAQTTNPFIALVEPSQSNNAVTNSKQFIIGSTCSTCELTINDKPVKVYPTGAFAYEVQLSKGENTFFIVAKKGKTKQNKTLLYSFTPPVPARPVGAFGIESVETFPAGDLLLKGGDEIQFKIKAFPGCNATVLIGARAIPLYEMPVTSENPIPGIYQGNYVVTTVDSFQNQSFTVTLNKLDNKNIVTQSTAKLTANKFTVLSKSMSDVLITKGRLAHLEYGLGEDRLGGAKIGYIDSLVQLKLIGKVGTHYKVRLATNRVAYIPEEHVSLLPKGTFTPSSLTGKIKIYGDTLYDYVSLQLFSRLPYQSIQQTEPSKIIVDVFGATCNTNWIDQLQTAKEIKKLEYEQIADDIFRVYITLQHAQHWGYRIYYSGTNLIVKINRQPKSLLLKDLTIAVDAGHGGNNTGAGGPTGVSEKDLTLQLSLKVKKQLEKEGAHVIMTREKEMFFDNKERILFYRDSTPNLLISIHLNSATDPINVSGTSTFYRYVGFRALSNSIYKRMLETGMKEYGNNGSFNFMLNSPTEYPNALIETLFLSNPEEEMKILDPQYQQFLAEKIVLGIKDFLESCK